MTLDELVARESIRDTMATYTMAGDRLRIEEFVGCFTADGVLESNAFEPGQRARREGHAAIRAFLTGFDDRPRSPHIEPPRFVRHHLATSRIELTGPDTATARTYFSVHTQIGLDHAGHYSDSFRKAGDRWLIAERRVFTNWHSPQSLFRREA